MRIAFSPVTTAGFAEKERLKPLLSDLGIEFEDLGTTSEESVDYPGLRVPGCPGGGRWSRPAGTACLRIRNRNGDHCQQSWGGRARGGGLVRRDGAPGTPADEVRNVLAIGARTTPPDEIATFGLRAWFRLILKADAIPIASRK